MSNRRSNKNVRRTSPSIRGGSRPIDPRRAPGYEPRRGPDPFAIGLIIASSAAVLIFVLFLALRGSNNTTPPTVNNTNNTNATPNWTQTTVAFSTQTSPGVLPRVSLEETKALYDAGNARLVDVRLKNLYDAGHIKGATNVPHTDIASRIKDLPKTGNIILYCQ